MIALLALAASIAGLVVGGYMIAHSHFAWRTEISERVAHLEGHLCGGPEEDDPDDPDEDEIDPPKQPIEAPPAGPDVRLLN